MKKKLIASAVVFAVAMSAALPLTAANPNAKVPLPEITEAGCEQTESGIAAYWYDNAYDAEAETKFGGDLEVDAELSFNCYVGDNSSENYVGSEIATVDVDLSQDEFHPFFYDCLPGGDCGAHIDWEDLDMIVEDAAAERWGDLAEDCVDIGGRFATFGATLEDSTAHFGVKKMNPGKGNGRQNYAKEYASCDILDSESQ